MLKTIRSCRNCQLSIHDGYHHVRLICQVNRQVVSPFSTLQEENAQHDENMRARADTCEHYRPDVDGGRHA
jgi:hypothetical protein